MSGAPSSSARSCRVCGATESPRWNGRECWECQKARVAAWKRARVATGRCVYGCGKPIFKGRECEARYRAGLAAAAVRHAANPEANRAKARAWAAANPERVKAVKRAYYAANTEMLKAKVRAYAAADPARKSASDRAYRVANREALDAKKRAYVATPQGKAVRKAAGTAYRARRHGAPGRLRARDWRATVERQGGRCIDCGDLVALTVGHLVPLSREGTNDPANIVGQCAPCNSRQGTKIHPLAA